MVREVFEMAHEDNFPIVIAQLDEGEVESFLKLPSDGGGRGRESVGGKDFEKLDR